MFIRDVMSQYPTGCSPATSIAEAARLMRQNDFGVLPVLESDGRPVGVITDRDIVCRAVAAGGDPSAITVGECSSQPVICLSGDADIGVALDKMKQHQVRRVVVVNDQGSCIGILSQADLAGYAGTDELGEVTESIVQMERPITTV